jgi:hypothetical protein
LAGFFAAFPRELPDFFFADFLEEPLLFPTDAFFAGPFLPLALFPVEALPP